MKIKLSYLSIILLSSLYFLISCAKPEDTISNSKDNDTDSTQLPIGPRSDIGCEDCVEQSHCCCKVILDQEDPIILEICGVTIIWENPCSLNTGAGPCYSIGSRAIQDTLDESNTAIYFCCFPGSSFALHNRNGSGSGRVKVGCSSTIGLGPLLEVNLDYGNGSYVRHFLSNNACEIDSCDW